MSKSAFIFPSSLKIIIVWYRIMVSNTCLWAFEKCDSCLLATISLDEEFAVTQISDPGYVICSLCFHDIFLYLQFILMFTVFKVCQCNFVHFYPVWIHLTPWSYLFWLLTIVFFSETGRFSALISWSIFLVLSFVSFTLGLWWHECLILKKKKKFHRPLRLCSLSLSLFSRISSFLTLLRGCFLSDAQTQ